jgi:hypothetical protein
MAARHGIDVTKLEGQVPPLAARDTRQCGAGRRYRHGARAAHSGHGISRLIRLLVISNHAGPQTELHQLVWLGLPRDDPRRPARSRAGAGKLAEDIRCRRSVGPEMLDSVCVVEGMHVCDSGLQVGERATSWPVTQARRLISGHC